MIFFFSKTVLGRDCISHSISVIITVASFFFSGRRIFGFERGVHKRGEEGEFSACERGLLSESRRFIFVLGCHDVTEEEGERKQKQKNGF